MADKKSNLKKVILELLNWAGKIGSAAASFCPILGFADPIIKIILHFVDDGDLEELKLEFGKIHDALDEILQKNKETCLKINMATIEIEFSKIDSSIVYQYSKYKEAIAEPGDLQMGYFENCYKNSNGDKNMHNLYNAVMGENLFMKLEDLQDKKDVMEKICKRISYLFYIGSIAMMGYYAVIKDDLQGRSNEWVQMLKKVHEKLEGMRNNPKPAQPMS